MSNEVYANGMELACKSGEGKSICCFPDVCFTPPENPATPPGVPIPYPNTGMASDTTDGSKTVQITGKEVMLKNKSYFKQSTGDEAGCAAKKGVVTSVNKGKVYFTAWSMDVKFEGENVVRNLDLTTHNHASPTSNTPPWPFQDGQAMADDNPCKKDKDKKDTACKTATKDPHCPGVLGLTTENFKKQVAKKQARRRKDIKDLNLPELPKGEARSSIAAPEATRQAQNDDCVKAARCQLKPYKPKGKQKKCCPGQTPHHIPPKACFSQAPRKLKYNQNQALCVCLEGTSQHFGSHGKNHAAIDHLATQPKPGGLGLAKDGTGTCTIREYNKICAAAVAAQCNCDPACIQAQLDASLQSVDRTITHAHSSSKVPFDDVKGDMNKHYDALSPKSIAK
jgi:hypothetical protein